MKKEGQKAPNTPPKRESDLPVKSPQDESSLKKSSSSTSLLEYTPNPDLSGTRRRSFFIEKLGLRRKRSSVEITTAPNTDTTKQTVEQGVDKLRQSKRNIDEQRTAIDHKLSGAISIMPNDFELLQFLLNEFSVLMKKIIEDRKTLNIKDQYDLDTFVFQQQPPHVIYLYCDLILHDEKSCTQNSLALCSSSSPRFPERRFSGPRVSELTSSDLRVQEQTTPDQIKLEWLKSLIEKSSPDLVNTLIYIATQRELANSKIDPNVLFRDESLSSKISACYVNAHAQKFLHNLVKEVIDLMRELPDWPMGYNIDANTRQTKGKGKGKILTHFTNMIVVISKKITSVECDPVIASIIALRYDLTFQSYNFDIEIASKAAISLFWLRLFVPLFRSNTELLTIEDIELPVFKRVSTLLMKASSGVRFNVSDEHPINTQLNKIIENHLLKDFRLHLVRIIENKSPPRIYNFKEKEWVVFRPLLSPAADLESTLDLLCN